MVCVFMEEAPSGVMLSDHLMALGPTTKRQHRRIWAVSIIDESITYKCDWISWINVYIYISLFRCRNGMPLSGLSIMWEELQYIHKAEGKEAWCMPEYNRLSSRIKIKMSMEIPRPRRSSLQLNIDDDDSSAPGVTTHSSQSLSPRLLNWNFYYWHSTLEYKMQQPFPTTDAFPRTRGETRPCLLSQWQRKITPGTCLY